MTEFPVSIEEGGFPVSINNLSKLIKGYKGKTAAFFGDSITNNASAGAGRDYTRQLTRILGSAVISDVYSLQLGYPGNNSTQIVDRYDSVIRGQEVDVLFSMFGINNVIQGLPFETFVADIKRLHQKTTEDGIPWIVGMITPLGTTEQTTSRKEMIIKCNTFLKLYCSTYGIPLADTYTPLALLSGASGGTAFSGYYNADGIHPNTYGHFFIGKAFADAFNGLFTAPHLVDHINPYNLVANPTLIVDTLNWQEQAGGTGSAATYSAVNDTTGKLKYGKWYQADWDATTGGQKYVRTSSINLTTAGVVAGDKLLITARCDYEDLTTAATYSDTYEFAAAADNPTGTLQLFVMDSSFVTKDTLDCGAVAKPGPVAKIFTVPAGMTGLIIAMFIKLPTGKHVKFKIGEVGVFKVTGLTDIIDLV